VGTSAGGFQAPNLVIATGGLSIPATGATGFGYEVAKQFDVPLTPLRAGLVPLALDAPDMQKYGELSGVALEAIVSAKSTYGASFRENVLVTHRGLSGPAILQISNYWNAGESVRIDLLPDIDGDAFVAQARASKKTFANLLAEHVPERFAQAWTLAHAPHVPPAQWNKADAQRVANELKAWSLKPSGTLGYKKAEVTLGGVDTRALSSKTMMVTAVPGLHFIGEVVDVTGWLGGYNFQWAWASGFACAQELQSG
jgi:predicted Rossmann fold flavoprotein